MVVVCEFDLFAVLKIDIKAPIMVTKVVTNALFTGNLFGGTGEM